MDRNAHSAPGNTETTPLLADVPESTGFLTPNNQSALLQREDISGDRDEANGEDADDEEDTPFPKSQLAVLCLARMTDSLGFFGIFPFVAFMIQDVTGIPEAEVGFYSGLIESLFSIVQAFAMLAWARLADIYGRKPIIIVSMIGGAFFTLLFGMSATLWQMILFRCLCGAFAGSVGTLRTMSSEMSTNKTRAMTFSYLAVANSLSMF